MTISYNRKNKDQPSEDQPSEDQPSEVEFNIKMADSTLHSFTIKEFTDQMSDLDYISFVVLVNTDGTENILSENNKSLTAYISKKNKPIN